MCRYLKQTRDALIKDFVCHNLGPDALNRENWLNHNTFILKQLLECKYEQRILVADDESSN